MEDNDELKPIRLIQAEAIDDLNVVRFMNFESSVFESESEILVSSVDSNKTIGSVRAFWDSDACVVMFLATLDYESPDRLSLENQQLALAVSYSILDAYPDDQNIFVKVRHFKVLEVGLTNVSSTPIGPDICIIPLKAAKTWRWQ